MGNAEYMGTLRWTIRLVRWCISSSSYPGLLEIPQPIIYF